MKERENQVIEAKGLREVLREKWSSIESSVLAVCLHRGSGKTHSLSRKLAPTCIVVCLPLSSERATAVSEPARDGKAWGIIIS